MEQVNVEKSESRKVREDFDPTSSYRVDVVGCTEEEKVKVQQAFFDTGFQWGYWGKKYKYLNAAQYSNTTSSGTITENLLYGSTAERNNMTAQEFLTLVYEPEHQGHVHYELMAQYVEDAKTHAEPWKFWEFKGHDGIWRDFVLSHPAWNSDKVYRRKPKTHSLHGVEIPDLRIEPKNGQEYWYPDPSTAYFVGFGTHGTESSVHRLANNLCYKHTEQGKQAAVLHAKAMLGI